MMKLNMEQFVIADCRNEIKFYLDFSNPVINLYKKITKNKIDTIEPDILSLWFMDNDNNDWHVVRKFLIKYGTRILITEVTSWFYIDDESFRREEIAKNGTIASIKEHLKRHFISV